MKKLILTVMLAFGLVAGAQAAGGEGLAWDKAPSRTNDLPALQHGAKLFVNYCLNCHSAAFMRFNRLQDIGLTEQQIKDNLLTVTDRVGDVMKAPIDPKEAKEWFGGVPPDLTLIARSRAGHGGTAPNHSFASFGSIGDFITSPTLSDTVSRLSLICCSEMPMSCRRLKRMNAAEWQFRQ